MDLGIRLMPDMELADFETPLRVEVLRIAKGMQAVQPDTGIDIVVDYAVPSLRPENGGPAEALVRAITGDNGTHVVSYGTEAGQFQEAGISAVICGPGDIAQAHQPNEYLEESQLAEGAAFLSRLIVRLAA